MRHRILSALALAGALLFLASGARAQTQTNVTATITDPLGIPYANGTYSIQLIPTGNNPTVNGRAIGGAFNGSTDANGRFNVSLWPNASISPGGTQWQITVCVSPGVQPPLGTGGQCSTPPLVVTIAGASQNLSSALSAVVPKLTTITIGTGTVTSVSGTAPIVATPNPILGTGSISCATCVATGQTNVYGAFLQDFSAATMEIPEAAGFTANVDSTIGLDTTANITHLWTNNADSSVCATTATDTTTTHAMFATAVAGICNLRAIATGDLPSGTITGSAVNTDVSFGTGTNTVGTNAGFTFNTGTGALSIPNHSFYQIGGANFMGAPNVNTDTVVGLGAGAAIGTNQNTTFIGLNVGQHIAAGNNNTAVGSFAMQATSSAVSENVAIGSEDLANVTNNDNTCVGYDACFPGSVGQQNSVLGAGAGGGATFSGNTNTLIGYQSGATVTTGSNNIIIGDNSTGTEITTGSNNILIARNSSVLTPTASNQLDIGDVFQATGINTPSTAAASVSNSFNAKSYLTATNCSSSASPAVCGSAAAGSVALPTNAVSSSIVVNTTAVTANSQIFVQTDDTLGTKLGVTCNSTVATLVGGLTISARTPGTSFTIANNVAVVTNPLCVSYYIVN